MNIKPFLAIISIVVIALAQYTYSPLTGRQKSQFKRTHTDLMTAYNKADYGVFMMFSERTLAEYQNILLDPGSKDLQKMYFEIDSLLGTLKTAERLQEKVAEIADAGTMAYYDNLVDIFSAFNSDSTLKYKRILEDMVNSTVRNLISLDEYQKIVKVKNIDPNIKNAALKKVKRLLTDRFVELSSTLDYAAILQFSKDFPEIFTADIELLLEKAQTKTRLTIIRNPNFDKYDAYTAQFGHDEYLTGKVKEYYRNYLMKTLDMAVFETYYTRFPADDFRLFQAIEDRLYRNYEKNRSTEAAILYLKYFPSGRYAQTIHILISGGISNEFVE